MFSFIIAKSKSDDRVPLVRGKSELHRAGCWVIPSGGDSKDSATEIDRLARGKDGKVR